MEMKKKIIIVVMLVIIGLISEFLIAGYASNAENYKHTIQSLDDKKITVMELTAASLGASTLVAAIPGDATTPIANKLADISTYLLVVLTAIFLEKYMITLAGMIAFRILIPLFCALVIAYIFIPRNWMAGMAKKVLTLAVVIVLVVPLSVKIGDLIESTKDMSAETTSIESVVDNSTVKETAESTAVEENKGLMDKIKDFVNDTEDKISNKTDEVIEDAKVTLNNFIEDVAIMLVTSCLIPILTFVFLLWFVKMIFGIKTEGTSPSAIVGKIRGKKKPEQLTIE